MDSAINLFLKKAAVTKTIPFSLALTLGQQLSLDACLHQAQADKSDNDNTESTTLEQLPASDSLDDDSTDFDCLPDLP